MKDYFAVRQLDIYRKVLIYNANKLLFDNNIKLFDRFKTVLNRK